MAFEFFKPTLIKTTGMLAVAVSMLTYAATSDAPPRFAFLAAFALTGMSFFCGAYVMLSQLKPYLPAAFRPTVSAPAA